MTDTQNYSGATDLKRRSFLKFLGLAGAVAIAPKALLEQSFAEEIGKPELIVPNGPGFRFILPDRVINVGELLDVTINAPPPIEVGFMRGGYGSMDIYQSDRANELIINTEATFPQYKELMQLMDSYITAREPLKIGAQCSIIHNNKEISIDMPTVVLSRVDSTVDPCGNLVQPTMRLGFELIITSGYQINKHTVR